MCTRILWSTNEVAKVVGRTMDWAVSDEPDLWSLPAGIERQGNAGPHSATWTSKYPSVVLSMWRSGTVDGMQRHRQGFGKRALTERDFVCQLMALRDFSNEVLAKRAVDMRHPHRAAVESHIEALVLLALEAIFAPVAGKRRRHGHPVADGQSLDARAE